MSKQMQVVDEEPLVRKIYPDAEEERAAIEPLTEGMNPDQVDRLALLLLEIQTAMGSEGGLTEAQADGIRYSLSNLVELVFRKSEPYYLLLELYESRFDLIGTDPAEIMRDLMKKCFPHRVNDPSGEPAEGIAAPREELKRLRRTA